ncbi:MAG: hypothetical protein Q9225_001879 [Loekoesia sp. 1 TL-2023]
MVTASSGILWLVPGGDHAAARPETGLVTGFGRCMSSECSDLDFIILALETIAPKRKMAESIVKVLRATVSKPRQDRELEYAEKNGILCINRVLEANCMNDRIFASVVPQDPEIRRFGEEPKRALTLTISSPGLLDTLNFVDDPAREALGSEEVEIKVFAVGVNFKNVTVALGQLPDKSLGLECAGIVNRIGTGVSAVKIGIGDRVCCVAKDAFKTYTRSHMSSVHRIPSGLSFVTAAALPVVFCTAYYSLHHLAGLKKGKSILIHAGVGGVGQAAIQLARLAHAEIYVTVGTEQRKRLVRDLYDIPEERIFSSRSMDFAPSIKDLTNNRGVDVVLNSLAGQSLRESFGCVAPLGRFIEIGKVDIYTRKKLPMAPFLNGVTFASVDLGVVAERNQQLMAELMEAIMSLATGSIRPPHPVNIFRVSEVESAFRSLQSGKSAGKTVIKIGEDDLVAVCDALLLTLPTWHFDENATYVISGGLGGLGRSIVRWMVGRKAKYLLLLSRSGANGEAAATLLKELEDTGVHAEIPLCDISSEEVLISVLARYTKTLPPIKGCIQASMVLKDSMFENMTLENFKAALGPRFKSFGICTPIFHVQWISSSFSPPR